MEKPESLKDGHLEFLDELSSIGSVNMMGARPWLEAKFPYLNSKEAAKIMVYWMKTFSDRHPN